MYIYTACLLFQPQPHPAPAILPTVPCTSPSSGPAFQAAQSGFLHGSCAGRVGSCSALAHPQCAAVFQEQNMLSMRGYKNPGATGGGRASPKSSNSVFKGIEMSLIVQAPTRLHITTSKPLGLCQANLANGSRSQKIQIPVDVGKTDGWRRRGALVINSGCTVCSALNRHQEF